MLKIQSPPRLPLVLPSILSADFARLGEEIEDVMARGADAIHVDVMDGHFVPNLTFGPPLLKSLRKRFPAVYFDVHLMVTNPGKFIGPFADAGADSLTFHIEPTARSGGGRDHDDEHQVIEQIRKLGCDVGITINPPTPAQAIEHVLDEVDIVLVMSVNPGFGGQSFMPEVLDKVRWIRQRIKPTTRLEMDGGISDKTVDEATAAGCDMLVAGNYVFSAKDRTAAMKRLRGEL
ncbi:MAG: ribulose-phosphate 3-epimerase [Phycisphaerales bacterium]